MFIQSRILENLSQDWGTKKLQWYLSNGVIPWCLLGSDPPPKIVLPHVTFLPYGDTQSVSHFLPKLSSTFDMLPKNQMKYPLYQLYQVSSSRIRCDCFSFNLELSSQSHIERISFLIFLELKCNSSINMGCYF